MTTEAAPVLTTVDDRELEGREWEPFAGLRDVDVKYLFRDATSVAGVLYLHPTTAEPRHLHVSGRHHIWVVDGDLTLDGRQLFHAGYVHVPAGLTHTVQTSLGCTLFFVYERQA